MDSENDHTADGGMRARSTDPTTSHIAAASITKAMVKERERKILDVLIAVPDGLTAEEVTNALGEERVSISPMFAPMRRKGLLHDTGITRLGKSKRPAIVWAHGPGPNMAVEQKTLDSVSAKLSEATKHSRGIRLDPEEVRQLYAMMILMT